MISSPFESDQGSILGDLLPDLTPMLDILFILLVFFMLTMGASLSSLKVTLPSAEHPGALTTQDEHVLILTLFKDHYALEDQTFSSLEELKPKLHDTFLKKPKAQLLLATDRAIPVERLLKLLSYLRTEHIETADILMKDKGT